MKEYCYQIPRLANFLPGEREKILAGEIPDTAMLGAWRPLSKFEAPHPRHVMEQDGQTLVPTRLYGPGKKEMCTSEEQTLALGVEADLKLIIHEGSMEAAV